MNIVSFILSFFEKMGILGHFQHEILGFINILPDFPTIVYVILVNWRALRAHKNFFEALFSCYTTL